MSGNRNWDPIGKRLTLATVTEEDGRLVVRRTPEVYRRDRRQLALFALKLLLVIGVFPALVALALLHSGKAAIWHEAERTFFPGAAVVVLFLVLSYLPAVRETVYDDEFVFDRAGSRFVRNGYEVCPLEWVETVRLRHRIVSGIRQFRLSVFLATGREEMIVQTYCMPSQAEQTRLMGETSQEAWKQGSRRQ